VQLKNKVALVTGGSQGIGREISLKLASMGANVAICSIPEAGEDVASEIKKMSLNSKAYITDVSNSEETKKLIENVVSDFGGLDILINNAGITRDGLAIRMSEDDFDKVIAVNLKGVFNCSQAAAKVFMKNESSAIVNLSSVIGLHGNAGQANYAASKAGVIGLTKTFAKELAKRTIRVNAVAPGFIKTAMTDALKDNVKETILDQIPLSRLGTTKEVASLVGFLASDMSSYITGQVVVIDGGLFI